MHPMDNSLWITMRHRRGWGGRGRRPKPIMLGTAPSTTSFVPTIMKNSVPVELHFSELEALRLVDQEGLNQEEAGKEMHVSRGTVWRLLKEGRKKVVTALTAGRPLSITPQGSLAPDQQDEGQQG